MNLPITIPTHRDVAWYVEECRVLKAALDGLQHPYIESRKRMAALETELDKLRAQIGTPPDGSHPDEQIPRAGTWHQERLNWISEIETARAYIAKCETQIKERASMMRDVMRERDKAEAELKEWSLLNLWGGTPEIVHAFVKGQQARIHAAQDLEAELKVSRAIVSKIWVQLGSPTYEQLKGRSIYDLIDELKAELAKERARLDWLSKRGFEHRHHETGDHLGYEWTISSYSEPEDVTLRDAIDAEMREEAK